MPASPSFPDTSSTAPGSIVAEPEPVRLPLTAESTSTTRLPWSMTEAPIVLFVATTVWPASIVRLPVSAPPAVPIWTAPAAPTARVPPRNSSVPVACKDPATVSVSPDFAAISVFGPSVLWPVSVQLAELPARQCRSPRNW